MSEMPAETTSLLNKLCSDWIPKGEPSGTIQYMWREGRESGGSGGSEGERKGKGRGVGVRVRIT